MSERKNYRRKRFVVYKATCRVNGKAYIGKTIYTAQHRWYCHVSIAMSGKSRFPISRAIKKHGANSFILETLYEGVDEREINAVEKGLIASHGTYAPRGYNITSGGEGVSGLKFSEETLAKMRGPRGPSSYRGKKYSKERKIAHLPHCKKLKDTRSKPIYCVETGESWPNIISCARSFGVRGSSQLTRAINSDFRKWRGLTFRDIEGTHNPAPSEGARHKHPIKCVETGVVYLCQADATMALSGNKNTMGIYKCLDKPNRTYRGFHFVSLKSVKEAA